MNKLCECGCGKEVKLPSSKFCQGHHPITDEIKLKRKNTCKHRYCEDNPSKIKEFQNKKIETSRKKYGSDHPMQCKEVQNKFEKANIEKYGKPNPMMCMDIQKKVEQSMMKKHGAKHALQCNIFLKKSQDTCFENYKVKYPYQSKEIQEKGMFTSRINCGFDWWSQSPNGKKFQRIKAIKEREDRRLNHEPDMPNIGVDERICLNTLESIIDKKIIRNNHDYAYIIGRYPDGEVKELSLFIQYNEYHHYIDEDMKIENNETIQTTLDLASNEYIGTRIVFNISEKQWKENQEQVIEQFKILVKELSIGIH